LRLDLPGDTVIEQTQTGAKMLRRTVTVVR